jgi:hypothetical protein
MALQLNSESGRREAVRDEVRGNGAELNNEDIPCQIILSYQIKGDERGI